MEVFDTQPTPIKPGAVSAESGSDLHSSQEPVPVEMVPQDAAPDHAWLDCASRRWRIGVPVVLLLFVTLAFMPALTAGFAYWDDDDLVLHNRDHLSFSVQNLKWMFSTTQTGHFQPLTWLTYAMDYQLWSSEAFGYHLTNVLFHLAATLTFYFVVRTLLTVGMNLDPVGLGQDPRKHSKAVLVSAMFAALVLLIVRSIS